jgi:precorrin-6B C5,15-methyltransferase / cobalt-precorrin-6B C5,C15-methyltransferase
MASVLHVRGVSQHHGETPLRINDFAESVAIVASRRLYKSLLATVTTDKLPPLIPLVPLAKSLQEVARVLKTGNVTLLASGDPLFYGIGRKLMEVFPQQEIRFHPALSSMQLCFARFGIPWDDARIFSLHGRKENLMAAKLLGSPKVFVFTDPLNSPDAIARELLMKCNVEDVREATVYVGENIGSLSERLFQGSLMETATQNFCDPNVMILTNPESPGNAKNFGLQEYAIQHSRGLITKNEVRAAVIHALFLPRSGVLWDIGAGSGSVGLECARLYPDLHVQAVEKEEEQWQNIEANRSNFRTWNLDLIKGAAPEMLETLTRPDRVFVGGSGGNLEEILGLCAKQLLPGGIIVVNAVIARTAKLAPQVLHKLGFQVEIKTVAVSRRMYPYGDKQQFNSIDIVVATKDKQEP